ncbi:TetR/AcrR family transcriptional regulator [Streptomyces sp. NPDC090025]|uniref:TetR/AcrR family transcriptional regulator n=1 Tax=Streptomyces sp. NPDC090025 TaxID=3365922 RepID=UPI0038387B53
MDLTEAEILERGLESFAELGYQGASVRELAKRLGVSHNFINDRFGSKENFWRAAVAHASAEPQRNLVSAFAVHAEAEADDIRTFEALVRVFYRGAVKNPVLNRIITAESALDSPRLDYLHGEVMRPFLEGLEPLVQRLMDAGRMARIPMDTLFSALTGPALVFTQDPLAARLGRSTRLTDAEWEQAAQSLAELVLRGLLPGTPGPDA